MTNKNDRYNHLNNPEEVGSVISKFKKEHNFQVPENYFNELPIIIQERVKRKKVRYDISSIYNYLTKTYKLALIGSLAVVVLLGIYFISKQKADDQMSLELSFEDVMEEYPEMIENMDDQLLIDFAVSQMTDYDFDLIDYEIGFDSLIFQKEVFPHLSDEEISEIIYNL